MTTPTRATHTAAILGISGYVGAELARLLLLHPRVATTHAASRTDVGAPVDRLWPHLTGLLDLAVEPLDALALARQVDVLFLALPHGATQEVVKALFEGQTPLHNARVIDLSGDFRLKDAAAYEAHYNTPHTAPHLLPCFAYGSPEWNRDRIVASQHVANPGCFATAIELALAPLAHAKLLPPQVSVFAATGSTGSGKKPTDTTHHPSRATNFKLYKALTHQHNPEIAALLDLLGGATRLSFIPASAPMTHGIFATAHMRCDQPERLADAIREAYKEAPFVRVREGSPELNHIVGSNFADVGVMVGEGELVVACAIDNTLKGAASQAIQNMNLMLGFGEEEGLLLALPPSLP